MLKIRGNWEFEREMPFIFAPEEDKAFSIEVSSNDTDFGLSDRCAITASFEVGGKSSRCTSFHQPLPLQSLHHPPGAHRFFFIGKAIRLEFHPKFLPNSFNQQHIFWSE
jgi:hypothetical protein